jgi:hypothetical protein
MTSYSWKPQLKHSLGLTLKFIIGWAIVAIILLLTGAKIEVGLLLGAVVTLWALPLIEIVTRTKIPDGLQLHYYAFITAASVLGSSFGAYGSIPHWDTYVHVYSGVFLALFGLFIVLRAETESKFSAPKWLSVMMAVGTPLAFATLWEITEYYIDLIFHTTMQAGGLEDTVIDMVAALVGGTIGILLVLWLKAPKSVLPRALVK